MSPAPGCAASRPTRASPEPFCAVDTSRHFGARSVFRKQSPGRSDKIWAMEHRAAPLAAGPAVVLASAFALVDKPRQLRARPPAYVSLSRPANYALASGDEIAEEAVLLIVDAGGEE
jgi:hypothetical protein